MKAAGKQLTDKQLDDIFSRVQKAQADIRAGRAVSKMGTKKAIQLGWRMQSTIEEIAQEAGEQIEREAAHIEYAAHLQVLKLGARVNDYKTLKTAGIAPQDAAEFTVVRNYKGVNVESMEQRMAGHKRDLGRKLLSAWDALGNDFLGFWQDKAKLLDLLRETRGEDTGNALAKKGAKAWLETAEEARQLFNRAGGEIGQLDDWAHPQHHSQIKVARAGGALRSNPKADEINQKAWVDHMMPLVQRTRDGGKHYIDDAGMPWTDGRLEEFLKHAWDTISTNGIANIEPGEFKGKGKVANRHAEERQIHFPDAQSEIDYWEKFGDKTAVEIMAGHIDTMARDIAMVEHFGPNPDTTWNTVRDTALKDAVGADRQRTARYQGRNIKLDNIYNYATGKIKPTANLTLSAVADAINHLNSAGKLGGAALASLFGDRPMFEAVSHMNDMPLLQRWRTQASLLNPANSADRRLLQQNGLMLDVIRSGLARFNETLGASSFSGKMANAVMKITGMTLFNELPKASFGMNAFAAIGKEIANGREFATLPDSDMRLLRNWGINASDWGVWKLAKRETISGVDNILTPESIGRITDAELKAGNVIGQVDGPEFAAAARKNAIVKLLGAVETESEFAIVTPGLKEKAQFYGNLQRGTVWGELGRAVLQFKSFPWAYFQRGIDFVANQQGGWSKAGATAYLVVGTTLAGAMLMETRDMLAGKDPRNFTGERGPLDLLKFWGAAMVQGGAMGIYGDFLYSTNQTRYGTGPLEVMAGPTVGPALEMALVQPMNALKAQSEGKPTHLAPTILRDLKGFVPGGNVWFAKPVLDHMIWMQVMEMLSPGYLNTIRQQTQKDYGQDWWYRPGDVLPDRPPNVEKAYSR